MAKPTDKSPGIENFLGRFFGIDRRQCIKDNVCVFCHQDAVNFKDELSRKEFSISGLCQECQNQTFGSDEEFLVD